MMEICEVTADEYKKIVKPSHVFNTVEFNNLNAYKVEQVKYLLIKDSKNRYGICVGINEGIMKCPYSAPFGTMEIIKTLELQKLDEAILCMVDYAKQIQAKEIRLTLPPLFYAPSFLAVYFSSLIRNQFSVEYEDINFQLDLNKVNVDNYPELLPRNGRKNLRISLESSLEFYHCATLDEKEQAYHVIMVNRREKGYPLRMSFEQVQETIQIVEHDFFLIRKNGENIAAAQVFKITDDIAQVIYWGDIPGNTESKPINFLSYNLIKFYGDKGYRYLDIGPSTEYGVPNYGLCDFKMSIGCDMDFKFTLLRHIKDEV